MRADPHGEACELRDSLVAWRRQYGVYDALEIEAEVSACELELTERDLRDRGYLAKEEQR
jgi:hypothetical protein